ncbi:MAG TPA: hypothetical protein VFZ34_21055 [Blastocatellia bacterium]|nr:hypothetical protein [Blastocatellia bacterium]
MLKIRAEQMQAFQSIADKTFAQKLVKHLREKHGDTGVQLPSGTFLVFELPEETLKTMIHTGIARAREHEFTSEADLAGFVALMLETAPNFDDHPLLRRGLRDERVRLEERLQALLQNATEANWGVVKEEYDPSAWKVE